MGVQQKRQVALQALQSILRFMSYRHTRSAGWLVCQYAKTGGRSLQKALHSFRTMQGETSLLERYTATHERTNTILRFQRQLSLAAMSKIAHPVACTVSLDIQSLLFCESQDGIRMFVKSIFEMGQSVPENENIDPSGYLPGPIAVRNAVRVTNNNLRTKFVAEEKGGRLQFSGAVTVDRVHLKLQRKHYCDFTLHFIEVKGNGPFSDVPSLCEMLRCC